ncbi:MSF1-domain-containing protein, partial [Serendipita vermifera]
VKIFSQTHHYEDAWRTVTLAFFLRYPNRYASHVVSADVLSRTITPEGTLRTTRLILKRGALPAWFPRGLMHRAESWIVEESEVDVDGKVLTCRTRNLDHVKVMEVIETTTLKEDIDGNTIHKTEARFRSGLGWGLKRRIEEYSASKFKANIEKSRMGLALVVRLLREARLQSLPPPFGNRMTQDGDQWSYSDIHAAAVASSPSQSLLS